MITRKSPIYIDEVLFCSYSFNEKDDIAFIEQFIYDKRHDFIVDSDFYGIAIKIELSNDRNDKGLRRNVSLSLIDNTSRCEVATRRIKVNIRKDEYAKSFYADFPLETTALKACHTYKLVVCDDNTSEILGEEAIHLFGQEHLGHPSDWWTVNGGGVRPMWKEELYKSLSTIDHKDYCVRFNLSRNFRFITPMILSELEMRLYYPDGSHISTRFAEPQCLDFDNNIYIAELPFNTTPEANGIFYAEILSMEYPIAGFAFDTKRPDECGEWYGADISPLESYSPQAASQRLNTLLPNPLDSEQFSDEKDFEEALDNFIQSQISDTGSEAETDSEENVTDGQPTDCVKENSLISSLDHLTGIRAVKEKLTIYERVVRFNKMRTDKGLPTSASPLHAMFLGSPGTGKTTVAKMMGRMLQRAGVLSKGHVVVRERATLLGQNYNSESEKTLAAIEEAQGGILLIDEAYQLYQPNDSRDPGKFVIETLLTALADDSTRDWMLILAGYPDEMRRMFDMNPGFKSRIPESNIYLFDDFTEGELMEIAEKYLTRLQYSLSDDAHIALAERLKADYSRRGKTFGNARHVINMIQTEIIPSMAVRVTSDTNLRDNSLTEIQAADIPTAVEQPCPTSRPRIGFIA